MTSISPNERGHHNQQRDGEKPGLEAHPQDLAIVVHLSKVRILVRVVHEPCPVVSSWLIQRSDFKADQLLVRAACLHSAPMQLSLALRRVVAKDRHIEAELPDR